MFSGSLQEYLSIQFLGNSLQSYIFALGIFYGIFLFFLIVRSKLLTFFEKISQKTHTPYDDLIIHVIKSIGIHFYVIISVLLGLQALEISATFNPLVDSITLAIFVLYIVRCIQLGVSFFISNIIHKSEKESDFFDPSILQLLGLALKVGVFLIGLLVILQNLGFNVTTLVGGLGIGGIAIAFALQNVLSDIFASLSIFFDKPFKTGDFIIVGTDMGTVQKIGIRSTRIKTLQGEALVISNQELTTARVQNFQSLERRRVLFTLSLQYENSAAKLEKALQIIREIVDADGAQTELHRSHFARFSPSSLDIETVYYVQTGDYQVYMDEQERINFGIKKAFEKAKITFAYPTQKIILTQDLEKTP